MNQATHFSPSPMILQLGPLITMDSEQFLRFCGLNRDWRLERNERGEVEVMVPTGGETSSRNSEINFALQSWARRDQTGIVFDSSGGFCLPNSAIRSPDVSWVLKTRLKGLDNEEKKKFLPLCPDFVIELRSPTDRLSILQAKMDEYQTNDCRLGWLIDPQEMAVTVYRPGTGSVWKVSEWSRVAPVSPTCLSTTSTPCNPPASSIWCVGFSAPIPRPSPICLAPIGYPWPEHKPAKVNLIVSVRPGARSSCPT